MRRIEADSFIFKKYHDGTLKIVKLHDILTDQLKGISLCDTKKGDSENKDLSLFNSVYRSKQLLYDKVHSMNCDWFGTLTFSRKYTRGPDRMIKESVISYTLEWLKRIKKCLVPALQYVVIFEQHKKGGWHAHIVLGNTGCLTFIDSGRKFWRKNGFRTIYNLDEWKAGFSDFSRCIDPQACANYMCKYITKAFCLSNLNEHRFYCSRNLPKPEVMKIVSDPCDLKEMLSKDTGCYVSSYIEDIDEFVSSFYGDYEFMHQSSCEVEDNDLNFNLQTEKNFYRKIQN